MAIRDTGILLGLSLVGSLIVGACSSNAGPTGPDSAVASYSISDSGSIIADNLSYDNGTGTLVQVVAPGDPFAKTVNFPLPGSVEGVLHGHGLGTGRSKLKFRVLWTIDGQTQGDSTEAVLTSGGAFTVTIPHHSL